MRFIHTSGSRGDAIASLVHVLIVDVLILAGGIPSTINDTSFAFCDGTMRVGQLFSMAEFCMIICGISGVIFCTPLLHED
jgi:hypothetical protein